MIPAIKLQHRLEVAFRYAWFRLKVLLRQNIGVDKNFFAGDAAVRLSKGILPQGVRITCSGRTDGVGRQAMARISGLNFARAFGATYVDSPFTRLGHAPGDMSAWLDAWEKRFNFDRGEERIDSGDYEIVDYADYLLNCREITDKVVLRFQQCFWFSRRYPDSFEAIADDLRNKFGVAPRVRNRRKIRVAVHVRRGDVDPTLNALRFTPNARVVEAIECLRAVLKELDIEATFHVHSQGNAADFSEFASSGCEINLDSDAVWTMQQLVEADVLIMAKSSFSYIAAILNEGVKIYEPMFDPPQSSWIVRRGDGSFDREQLRERLDRYLGLADPDTLFAPVPHVEDLPAETAARTSSEA